MHKVRRWLWLIPALLLVICAGFTLWAYTPAPPAPEALAALRPDGQIDVDVGRWIVFRPLGAAPTTGFIFYPGGRVNARAYAPAARALAAQGYLVVIVKMPFNLAVFAPESADAVIAAYPSVTRWAIGGHSLGGAMAARYAYRHPEAVRGLVLWAAYPAAGDDLSARDLSVVTIYGTRDGLATSDKIEASRRLLPPSARWVPIEGGNHAQFGWYGEQAGDLPATISRAEQQAQIITATMALLASLP